MISLCNSAAWRKKHISQNPIAKLNTRTHIDRASVENVSCVSIRNTVKIVILFWLCAAAAAAHTATTTRIQSENDSSIASILYQKDAH